MRSACLLLVVVVTAANASVTAYHIGGKEGEKRDTSLFIDRPKPMAMLQACPG